MLLLEHVRRPLPPVNQNYAVEAEIQVVSEGESRGIVVHDGNAGHYKVGSDRGYGRSSAISTTPRLAEQPFSHNGGWHTYRVEVSATQIQLIIDGRRRAFAPTQQQYAPGSGVGLLCRTDENERPFRTEPNADFRGSRTPKRAFGLPEIHSCGTAVAESSACAALR